MYRVTGTDRWDELQAAAERAVALNRNFSGFTIERPSDGAVEGTVRLRSRGHDRSAITRRIVAPIRAVFHRAGVTPNRIMLLQQTVLPTGRNKTLTEGRTPPGTFATAELRQMLADGATMDGLAGGGIVSG